LKNGEADRKWEEEEQGSNVGLECMLKEEDRVYMILFITPLNTTLLYLTLALRAQLQLNPV